MLLIALQNAARPSRALVVGVLYEDILGRYLRHRSSHYTCSALGQPTQCVNLQWESVDLDRVSKFVETHATGCVGRKNSLITNRFRSALIRAKPIRSPSPVQNAPTWLMLVGDYKWPGNKKGYLIRLMCMVCVSQAKSASDLGIMKHLNDHQSARFLCATVTTVSVSQPTTKSFTQLSEWPELRIKRE